MIENNCKIDEDVKIGMNSIIKFGSVIEDDSIIGDNCIIGVGAIVTKDIPSDSVAVGVPARVIETIEEYKEKNLQSFVHTKGMSAAEKKKYLSDIYNGGN